MSMNKTPQEIGHKPGAEVQNYLDFLLQEATTPFEEPEDIAAVESTRAAPKIKRPTPEEHQLQAQAIAARATPLVKPVLEAPQILPHITPAPLTVAEPDTQTVIADVPAAEVVSEPELPLQPEAGGVDEHSDALPDPFQCLLFEVGTLKLAVPLMELGAICQLLEPLTPLFGQPDWYLGIYSFQGRNIRVVDTGHWVLQDRYSAELKKQYQFLLTFPDQDWGLAVSSLHEAVQIRQSEVAWRAIRETSPWMAGVVRKHMCALLDMEQFARCFTPTEQR